MDELKKRKRIRLRGADYNAPGAYFITICTKEKRCLLSRIVGTGVLDGPHEQPLEFDGVQVQLTRYGQIAEKHLLSMSRFYENLKVEKYVIMPNHIHMLIFLSPRALPEAQNGPSRTPDQNGPSGTPVPTVQNSVISRFVSTFKRFCNKEYGENIWQARSYDHIIRNQKDYEEHANYISFNPMRWNKDHLSPDFEEDPK